MLIDIESIIHKRTNRRLPKWLVGVTEKVIHQREINMIISSGKHLPPAQFIKHVLKELCISCEIVEKGDISPSGRYIFAANHPFGGTDGLLITDALLDKFGDVGTIVNDMLTLIDPLKPLWIPINKYGHQQSLHSLTYNTALTSQSKQILTFPAGFCSRIINGEVADTEWHSRFVKDAKRHNRKIVPVYVDGTLSQRFYNIYKVRRALGIGLNMELMLLVDEMFRQRGKCFKIVFGTPLDADLIAGNSPTEKCRTVREIAYSLKK